MLDLCQGAAVWPAVAMVATAVGLLARAKRSKIAHAIRGFARNLIQLLHAEGCLC